MGPNDEQSNIDRLYEFGERLNEAKVKSTKSTHVSYYKGTIEEAKGSQKGKQLAAQLIPRFYKYFSSLATEAMNAHFDLCEEEELGARFSYNFSATAERFSWHQSFHHQNRCCFCYAINVGVSTSWGMKYLQNLFI